MHVSLVIYSIGHVCLSAGKLAVLGVLEPYTLLCQVACASISFCICAIVRLSSSVPAGLGITDSISSLEQWAPSALMRKAAGQGQKACLYHLGPSAPLLGLNLGLCTGADHEKTLATDEAVGSLGPDEAEQQAEAEEPLQATRDDCDMEESLEEEDETAVLGGDQFTPEQIAMAEAAFKQQVSHQQT